MGWGGPGSPGTGQTGLGVPRLPWGDADSVEAGRSTEAAIWELATRGQPFPTDGHRPCDTDLASSPHGVQEEGLGLTTARAEPAGKPPALEVEAPTALRGTDRAPCAVTLEVGWSPGRWPRGAGTGGWEKWLFGASLVAQWLRILLPMQGTRVRFLVREDPTCCGAPRPVHHNSRGCALEPVSHNY